MVSPQRIRTLPATLAAWLVLGAIGCGPEGEGAAIGPPEAEPGDTVAVEPCPEDLATTGDPVGGAWIGWSDGLSMLLEIGTDSAGRITGGGVVVGTAWTLEARGQRTGDSLTLTLEIDGHGGPLEFTGRYGADLICGLLNGPYHSRHVLRDSPLVLERYGDHPLDDLAGGWELLTTTSAPDTLGHLEIQGDLWLVAALGSGLLLSRDAGRTWERPLGGLVSDVAVDPADPSRIVAIRDAEVVVSTDAGRTWDARLTLPNRGGSLDLGPAGSLWVAPTWSEHQTPGAFRSAGPGGPFTFHAYGGWEGEQLISWDILEVPWSGTVLVANEIGDHPVPYDPPFLLSRDGGGTWRDISAGNWTWHGYRLAADTTGRLIYNLLEGPGLWISADDGASWTLASTVAGIALLVEPGAGEVWIGQQVSGRLNGGVFVSGDGGRLFRPAGLDGKIIAGLARDAAGNVLAAVPGEGIYHLRRADSSQE